MKLFLQEYGRALFAMMVGILLFLLLFQHLETGAGKGILMILKARTGIKEQEEQGNYLMPPYKENIDEELIKFSGKNLTAKKIYPLKSIFMINQKMVKEVKVVELTDQKNIHYQVNEEELFFSNVGIYQTKIQLKTEENERITYVFHIPVRKDWVE